MTTLRSALVPTLVAAALSACGPSGSPPDAADVVVTDSPVDAAPDVITDTGPDPHATLTYRPMGCNYDVSTTMGTVFNQMSVDTAFGAMPDPVSVHLTWPSDPSTGVAALWSTDADTLASVVEYGTSMTSLDHMQRGHVTTAGAGMNAVHEHEVHLCGLQPDTTYYYHVGGPGHFSAVHHFKTAPMPGDLTADVNFVVTGDSREALETDPSNFPRDWHTVQSQVATASAAQAPDFQLFTGDAIFSGTNQPGWDTWFAAAPDAFANMPWVLLNGNHEGLSLNFLAQIAQPQATGELYFSFDYGMVHVVVLNDTPSIADGMGAITGAYATWLEQDLAAVNRTRTPWVIVTHHKGPYTTSMHANDADVMLIRATWPPIYDRHNVDVVINGHDHSLHVTHPLVAGAVAPSGMQGTVYVVSGGAGAPLYTTGSGAIYQDIESTLNFLLVHATAHTLSITPFRSDGTQITAGVVNLTHP